MIRYSSDGDAIVDDGDFDNDGGTSCGYRAVGPRWGQRRSIVDRCSSSSSPPIATVDPRGGGGDRRSPSKYGVARHRRPGSEGSATGQSGIVRSSSPDDERRRAAPPAVRPPTRRPRACGAPSSVRMIAPAGTSARADGADREKFRSLLVAVAVALSGHPPSSASSPIDVIPVPRLRLLRSLRRRRRRRHPSPSTRVAGSRRPPLLAGCQRQQAVVVEGRADRGHRRRCRFRSTPRKLRLVMIGLGGVCCATSTSTSTDNVYGRRGRRRWLSPEDPLDILRLGFVPAERPATNMTTTTAAAREDEDEISSRRGLIPPSPPGREFDDYGRPAAIVFPVIMDAKQSTWR